MLEILITPEERRDIQERAIEMGTLYGSFTRGAGNAVGCAGEFAVSKHLRGEIVNDPHFDIRVADGIKIEVKTKKSNYPPKDSYTVSVSDFNPNQKCDLYYFARVTQRLDKCWILGYMPREEFFERAFFLKKGQREGDNGFRAQADCHNMYIRDLYKS